METFSNKMQNMISMNKLQHIHPIINGLFTGDLSVTPPAERLFHFSKEWEILTKG